MLSSVVALPLAPPAKEWLWRKVFPATAAEPRLNPVSSLQVEDRGSERVDISWPALTEFTKGLLGHAGNIDPPNIRPADRPYTPSDAMIHFAYLFSQLRKTQ